jgi:hypothetical protein
LEEQNISFEAWAGALYPFMDIPALVTAIVLANIYLNKKRTASIQSSLEGTLSRQPVAAGDFSDPQVLNVNYFGRFASIILAGFCHQPRLVV